LRPLSARLRALLHLIVSVFGATCRPARESKLMLGRISIIVGSAAALAIISAYHHPKGAAPASGDVRSLVAPTRWDPVLAAAYLDQRQSWWESWPKSARDHGTVCVSCHTALPYALARPTLRTISHESDATPVEQKLVADVVTRVRAWNEVKPFYGDTTPKGRTMAVQSRGTEAILNALILASRDERAGAASEEARLAFANLFTLQLTEGAQAGSWPWLDFGLRPWESTTASYFGAALAAIAVGTEPQNYVADSAIQPNLDRLREYLRANTTQPMWSRLLRRHDDPKLFNRALLLWASAKLSGLLSVDERNAAVASLYEAQASDGSWKLSSLGYWRPAAGVAPEIEGDGYATGLIAYALQEVGVPPNESHLARALAWLANHQDSTTGAWHALSLNKHRDPGSNVGKFMSDAATAFAVLALTKSQQ
jgi:squalene-hopene/tetraprenyl-beta-curcumene cyclase